MIMGHIVWNEFMNKMNKYKDKRRLNKTRQSATRRKKITMTTMTTTTTITTTMTTTKTRTRTTTKTTKTTKTTTKTTTTGLPAIAFP